eukprot:763929-Hanusia_phi.AAC.3
MRLAQYFSHPPVHKRPNDRHDTYFDTLPTQPSQRLKLLIPPHTSASNVPHQLYISSFMTQSFGIPPSISLIRHPRHCLVSFSSPLPLSPRFRPPCLSSLSLLPPSPPRLPWHHYRPLPSSSPVLVWT